MIEWDHVYEAYALSLRRLVASRLPRGGPVDDLLQETFARAMKSSHLIDTTRAPWAFLATVAGRVVADWWTRDHPRQVAVTPMREPSEDYPGSDEHLQALDDAVRTRGALLKMNSRHRRVLYRYEVEDCSYDTLVEAERVSAQAVKSVLGRARACFQAHYRAAGVGPAAIAAAGWMRLLVERGRARLDRYRELSAMEALAAVGGVVLAAGVVVGSVGSPNASATASARPPGAVELDLPSPLIDPLSRSPFPGASGRTSAGVLPNESSETPNMRSSAPTPKVSTATGARIITNHDESTASFWLTVHGPVVGDEVRVGSETYCERGVVAAQRCNVMRLLPGSGS